MAYFKLSLLFLGDNHYADGSVELLPSVISEFISPTEQFLKQQHFNTTQDLSVFKPSFCYTYNEQLSKHQNGRKDLTFSMDRMVLQDNEGIENPYARNLQIGSLLCLEDDWNNQYLFTVTKIGYTFKLNNITYNISCQDSFSYQLTRQNDGYEIQNNSEDTDFIGAKNIDWWTNKIVNECNIPYIYIPLEQGLYQYEDSTSDITDKYSYSVLKKPGITKIIKTAYSRSSSFDESLFDTIPFSGSGNAVSILISLGEKLGMVLNTFEHFIHVSNGTNTLVRYFWFEPSKNIENSGLQYSPFDSVQQFSLNHAGEALTTILNVTGPTYEDELITLLPDVSPFFLKLFESNYWHELQYKPGMYSEVMKHTTYYYDNYQGGNFEVKNINRDTGELSFDIIDMTNESSDTIPQVWGHDGSNIYIPVINTGASTFYIPNLYDDYHFKLNNKYSGLTYIASDEVHSITSTETPGDFYLKNNASIQKGTYIENLFIRVPLALDESQLISGDIKGNNVSLFIDFFREPTIDDEEFATAADQIPWLENKLIDFTYFTQHNLMNKHQYTELMSLINNDLRIINGQLLWYTREYYKALHDRTETMANIQNAIDALQAAFNYSVVTGFETTGKIQNADAFIKSYETIFLLTTSGDKKPLLDYDKLLTSYMNKYVNANQRFLKSIKNFRDYFEDSVSFLDENAELTEDKIEIKQDLSLGYFFTFKDGQAFETINAFNVSDGYDTDLNSTTYGKPQVTFYDLSTYDTLEIVDQTNFTDYFIGADIFGMIENKSSDVYYDSQTEYFLPEYVTIIQADPDDIEDITSDITAAAVAENGGSNGAWDCGFEQGVVSNNDTYNYTITLTPTTPISSLIWYPRNIDGIIKSQITLTVDQTSYLFKLQYHKLNFGEIKQLGANKFSSQIGDSILLYKRNPDTYISLDHYQWANDNVNIKKYFNVWFSDPDESILTKEQQKELGGDEKSFKGNTDEKPATIAYALLNPTTTIYYLGRRYTNDTTPQIINQKGYTLYQYLKEQIADIDEDKKIKTNPFTDSYYNPITVANYTNGTSLGHRDVVSTQARCAGAIITTLSAGLMMLIPPYGGIGALALTGLGVALLETAQGAKSFKGVQSGDFGTTLDRNGAKQIKNDFLQLTHGTSEEAYNYNYFRPQSDSDIQSSVYNSILITVSNHNQVFDANQTKILTNQITISASSSDKVGCSPAFWNTLSSASTQEPAGSSYITLDTIPEENSEPITYYGTLSNLSSQATEHIDFLNTYRFENPTGAYLTHGNASLTYATQCYVKDSFYYILPQDTSDFYNLNQYTFLVTQMGTDPNNRILACEDANVLSTIASFSADFGSIGNFASDHLLSQTLWYPLAAHAIDLTVTKDTNSLETLLKNNLSVNNASVNVSLNDYPIWTITLTNNNGNQTDTTVLKGMIAEKRNYWLEAESSSTFATTTTYYTATNIPWDGKKQPSIVEGLFIHGDSTDNIKKATVFDINLAYYKENGQRVYTAPQVVNQYSVGRLNNILYTEINLNSNKMNFTVPVVQHIISKVNNMTRIVVQEHSVTLSTKNKALNTFLTNNEIPNAPIEYRISYKTLEKLSNYNNGAFWKQYHTQTDKPVLFELAAAIETQLQTYWSQAYNAALYSDWFLPLHWQDGADETVNYFAQSIYQQDGSDSTRLILKDTYIPHVQQLTDYTDKYQLTYFSSFDDNTGANSNYTNVISLNHPAFKDCFDFLQLPMTNWYAEKMGKTTYYQHISGGCRYSELISNLTPGPTSYDRMAGIYPCIIQGLLQRYKARTTLQYDALKQAHDKIGKTIYNNYPSMILEDNYKNDDATTSKDLMTLAVNYFKDKQNPERGYSVTLIDNVSLLHGYQGQELRIGDSIALRANDFYNGFDDIKSSLSQYLFITDIKYTLRKDTDISLTVNSIKYQDKLIQRLAQLIK